MIEYVLLTLMVSTKTINGVDTQSIGWNPTPISVHATYKDCEHAYNDLSGFPRRLTDSVNDYGWPKVNAMLRCNKVKNE